LKHQSSSFREKKFLGSKALYATEAKLQQYYSMTDKVPGDLYAISTIIAPQNRLQFFSGKNWEDPVIDYHEEYRKSLQDYLKPYRQRLSDTQLQSNAQLSAIQSYRHQSLTCFLHQQSPITQHQASMISFHDIFRAVSTGAKFAFNYVELIGPLSAAPRIFWKDHQHEFPALVSLARNVLSIPATGAGVERLFNSACDICHYRPGRPCHFPWDWWHGANGSVESMAKLFNLFLHIRSVHSISPKLSPLILAVGVDIAKFSQFIGPTSLAVG
jgi:hypothetical protein